MALIRRCGVEVEHGGDHGRFGQTAERRQTEADAPDQTVGRQRADRMGERPHAWGLRGASKSRPATGVPPSFRIVVGETAAGPNPASAKRAST